MPPPVLLRLPLGGTCDANGNLTIKSIVPSRSFYAAFTAQMRVTGGGNPFWTLDLLSFPLASGQGAQVALGPYVTAPEEVLTLTVTGAQPNAVMSGSLNGFFADTPEGLPLGLPAGGSFTIQATPLFNGAYSGTVSPTSQQVLAVAGTGALLVAIDAIVGAPGIQVDLSADGGHFYPVPFWRTGSATGLVWVSGAGFTETAAGEFLIIPLLGAAYVRLRVTGGGTSFQFHASTAASSELVQLPFGQKVALGQGYLAANQYAIHITANSTTTPTAATCYVSSIILMVTGTPSAWVVKIQNKEATPKVLFQSAALSAITPLTPVLAPEPVVMTNGIDIVTSGTTPGILDAFITYWQ